MAYSTIADGELEQNKVVTEATARKLRDNPIAIAAGDTGAPRVAIDLSGQTAIGTDNNNTDRVLRPNGSGGVEFVSPTSIPSIGSGVQKATGQDTASSGNLTLSGFNVTATTGNCYRITLASTNSTPGATDTVAYLGFLFRVEWSGGTIWRGHKVFSIDKDGNDAAQGNLISVVSNEIDISTLPNAQYRWTIERVRDA